MHKQGQKKPPYTVGSPAHIGLRLKVLAMRNTLAYFCRSVNVEEREFYKIGPTCFSSFDRFCSFSTISYFD